MGPECRSHYRQLEHTSKLKKGGGCRWSGGGCRWGSGGSGQPIHGTFVCDNRNGRTVCLQWFSRVPIMFNNMHHVSMSTMFNHRRVNTSSTVHHHPASSNNPCMQLVPFSTTENHPASSTIQSEQHPAPSNQNCQHPAPPSQNYQHPAIQHHPIRFVSIQYHPIVSIQHHPIRRFSLQHHPIRRTSIQHHPIRRSSIQHRPIRRFHVQFHQWCHAAVPTPPKGMQKAIVDHCWAVVDVGWWWILLNGGRCLLLHFVGWRWMLLDGGGKWWCSGM